MNMDQLKAEAEIAADQIDINWKALENPEYRKDFEYRPQTTIVSNTIDVTTWNSQF